ncbi:MAG: hypothetical protein GX838_03110 [Clostridiaceae bacterium]|nr:hypothetical protein [Clostridiaceae bacterium]
MFSSSYPFPHLSCFFWLRQTECQNIADLFNESCGKRLLS